MAYRCFPGGFSVKVLPLIIMVVFLTGPGTVLASYEIGDPVADITLANLEGGTTSLSDFTGKVVLINFFATWCPPCNDEVPLLQSMWEDYEQHGLIVWGIDLLEDSALVEDWVNQKGLTYPIALTPDWSVFQLFPGAGGFPYNAVIDQNGILRYGQYGINMEEITGLIQQLLVEDPVASQPASFDAVKALYR
jgi:peroxiredoxin